MGAFSSKSKSGKKKQPRLANSSSSSGLSSPTTTEARRRALEQALPPRKIRPFLKPTGRFNRPPKDKFIIFVGGDIWPAKPIVEDRFERVYRRFWDETDTSPMARFMQEFAKWLEPEKEHRPMQRTSDSYFYGGIYLDEITVTVKFRYNGDAFERPVTFWWSGDTNPGLTSWSDDCWWPAVCASDRMHMETDATLLLSDMRLPDWQARLLARDTQLDRIGKGRLSGAVIRHVALRDDIGESMAESQPSSRKSRRSHSGEYPCQFVGRDDFAALHRSVRELLVVSLELNTASSVALENLIDEVLAER